MSKLRVLNDKGHERLDNDTSKDAIKVACKLIRQEIIKIKLNKGGLNNE